MFFPATHGLDCQLPTIVYLIWLSKRRDNHTKRAASTGSIRNTQIGSLRKEPVSLYVHKR
jgi:hypothetical protein